MSDQSLQMLPSAKFGDIVLQGVQQATAIVRAENKATVALLQRRMNIGYAHAARLLDALEELGVVGPFNGADPREVLPSDEPEDEEGGED